MSRFPHLPETFILREMNALEAQGWQVALYPLIKQRDSVIHKEAERWVSRARYFPFFSFDILRANLFRFYRTPWSYIKLFAQVLRENLPSSKFLSRALFLFPKAVRMAEQMVDEEVDHVHAHYATHPVLVAWIVHQLTGLSYSLTVHAHDIFVDQTMLPTKLRDSAFVVAISAFNRDFLVQTVGETIGAKTHVVHCGIDPFKYQRKMEVATANERFEIITVGSLQAYKGQIYLLRACEMLRERGVIFRCRVIGEGEERPRLEAFIAAHQLDDHIELMGALAQDEVARCLQTADCYVQPSVITETGKMEGIPVSIMEAFASDYLWWRRIYPACPNWSSLENRISRTARRPSQLGRGSPKGVHRLG